ncbi:MAG: helix-turn-helix domain-containing protein [Acidaminobacteraceae bacterium]
MMDFGKISKARTLFKESGAIRREYIRDEIVYSWVRSRLYSRKKVEFAEEKTHIFVNDIEYTADEIIEFINDKMKIDEENYSIFIVGVDGRIKNQNYKNTKFGIKTPNSYREEHIGTNGIGIAFSLKKSVIVYGSEHYSSEFDEYISASILDIPFRIEKGVLGLIAKKAEFDDKFIDEIINLDYSLLKKKTREINLISNSFKENGKLEKQDISKKIENIAQEKSMDLNLEVDDTDYFKAEIPYCLIGRSKEKVKLKTLVMTKAVTSSLINIYGTKGIEGEYLARFIHENSTRSNHRFVRINPRIDISYVIDREIDAFQSGTLYIEYIDELNKKTMIKLQRKINCKLVYNNSESCSNEIDSAFFISNDISSESKKKNNILLTSLKLEINSIKECEDDLQYLISKLIKEKLKGAKGIKNLEIFSPIYIHAKSKEVLKEMLKTSLLSYSTVDETLDNIMTVTSKSIEVNQLKVDLIERDDQIEFKKLKEIELDYIKKVMNYTEDNIAKSSEILGIGRTTIYRKLKSQ